MKFVPFPRFFLTGLISSRRASSVEVLLIALTLFCLPSFEAPKNVFSVLFLSVWLLQAVRLSSVGRSSPFDWPIIGLASVLWISPLFSEFRDVITPINSAPRWTLLALFVMAAVRLDYSKTGIYIVWSALMVGGAYSVLESIHAWSLNGARYPELRSVGHVNHSSMYTLVTLAAGIGAILIPGKSIKVIGLTAIVSTIIYLPPSRSIVGAVAISSVMTLGIGAILVRRYSWWGLIIASIVTTLVVGGSLTSPQAAPFLVELSERISGLDPFSGRDRIINSALVVWKEHPFIGTGWFSFGAATSAESVQAVLERRGLDYNSDIYWHFPHGHNLWVTMLIERGLFGVAAVTMLLVMYLWHLVPTALGRRGDDEVGRGVALSAVLVVVGFIVAGLGNTTMMNEHGHAGMTVIAVAYGYIRATRQAAV